MVEKYDEYGEYISTYKCAKCGGNVSKAEDEEAKADSGYVPYCDGCAADD